MTDKGILRRWHRLVVLGFAAIAIVAALPGVVGTLSAAESASPLPQWKPTVVTSEDGERIIVVARSVLGAVVAFRSSDGGVTWSDPLALGNGVASVQVVGSDSLDRAVVFLHQKLRPTGAEGIEPSGKTVVRRSDDGGVTWSPGQVVLRPHARGTWYEFWPVADAALERISLVRSATLRNHTVTRQVAATSDGGVTWSAGESPAAGDLLSRSASADGRTAAMVVAEGNGPRRVWVSRDTGRTWFQATQLADLNDSRVSDEVVSVSRDGTGILVRWVRDHFGRPGVPYRTEIQAVASSDAGSRFTAVATLGAFPDEYVRAGDTAVSADGRSLLVTWSSDSGSQSSRSSDSGATWTVLDQVPLQGPLIGSPAGRLIGLGSPIRISADGGITWTVAAGPELSESFFRNDFASSQDGRVVAVTYLKSSPTGGPAVDSAVAVTRDHGQSWPNPVTAPWAGSGPYAVPNFDVEVSRDGTAVVAAWSQQGRLAVSIRTATAGAWGPAVQLMNRPVRLGVVVSARPSSRRLTIGKPTTLVRSIRTEGRLGASATCRKAGRWIEGTPVVNRCGLTISSDYSIAARVKCGVQKVRVGVGSEFAPFARPVKWTRTWRVAGTCSRR